MAGTGELHDAARKGDAQRLEALLGGAETPTEALNASDKHRRTPLHLAAFFGHVEAASVLLQKGADVQREAMDGFLALHFAAQGGYLEVVRLILKEISQKGEHGAVKRHVNRVVRKGKKTALHLALAKGHVDCARFLVMKGASTDIKSAQGQTALDLCKSKELRQELQGVSRSCSNADPQSGNLINDSQEARVEPPHKKRACEPASVKAMTASLPMSRLPARPLMSTPALEAALACGPLSLSNVEIKPEGDCVYPPGVAALAGIHFDMSADCSHEMLDGEVWSLKSHAVQETAGQRTLQISLLRSTRGVFLYTNMTEEGRSLPVESRCRACGVTVLSETSDGLIVFEQSVKSDGTHGSWQAVPSGTLNHPSLSSVLRHLFQEQSKNTSWGDWQHSVGSAKLLALIRTDTETNHGRQHELVIGLRLMASAAEMVAPSKAGQVGITRQIFVSMPGAKRSEAASAGLSVGTAEPQQPCMVSFEEFMDTAKYSLSEVSRTALKVLYAMQAAAE